MQADTSPLASRRRVRSPVRRQRAERYLLVMLLAFAASVGLTRFFLEMTGYPQLGGGGLHIAHVLWGGLILFAASIVPLLWSNRWVYPVGASLGGIGVGLFIDEVGKFITQTNDYFFAAAAPIVYTLFLITVFLYLRVRKPGRRDLRAELYHVFDGLQEWLDHDLDRKEKARLGNELAWIAAQSDQPAWSRLGQVLRDFLDAEAHEAPPARRGFLERRLQGAWLTVRRWLNERRLKAILTGGIAALALLAFKHPAEVLLAGSAPRFSSWLAGLALGRTIDVGGTSRLMLARVALEIVAGCLLLSCAALLAARRERLGVALGQAALLLMLTAANLLVFYYEQFSTILTAGMQFLALLGLLYYRHEFLE